MSTRTLFLLAVLSLILLAIFSDAGPGKRAGFSDMAAGEDVDIECTVSSIRESRSGHVLSLVDGNGTEASAFCRNGTLPEGIAPGAVIRLVATVSDDDPRFLFASSVELVAVPD